MKRAYLIQWLFANEAGIRKLLQLSKSFFKTNLQNLLQELGGAESNLKNHETP